MAVIHNDPVTQGSGRLLSDANLLPDALAKNGAANILTVTDDGINRLRSPMIVVPVFVSAWCAGLCHGRR